METNPGVSPSLYKRVKATADELRQTLPTSLQKPRVAIVCGSGLGGLADTIEEQPKVQFRYEDVKGFPRSTGTLILLGLMRRSGPREALFEQDLVF